MKVHLVIFVLLAVSQSSGGSVSAKMERVPGKFKNSNWAILLENIFDDVVQFFEKAVDDSSQPSEFSVQ